MNRHRVYVTLTAGLGAAAFFAIWWLIADLLLKTAPQLLHSTVDVAYCALVILVMVIAILSGVLVGIQAYHSESPHRHRFGFHHPHLRH